jgi:hypothetical protein
MSLLQTLGLTPETATMQFLKNNNLHNQRKALHGAVLLINLCIGMIVKSVGSFILFHVLFPCRLAGFEIIDLRKRDQFFGFFLQQIWGPRMGIMSSRQHGNKTVGNLYSYCIEGNVYMDPLGPDFCVSKNIANVPSTIAQDFEPLEENLFLKLDEKTPSTVRNL